MTGTIATYAPLRGRALCALGRFDEAEPLAKQGRELAGADDLDVQILWRQVMARVHTHRGNIDDAEHLAREAIAIAQRTDSPVFQAEALSDLAEVQATANRREDAVMTWHDPLDLYDQKGIIPLVRRTRERLAALQAPTA